MKRWIPAVMIGSALITSISCEVPKDEDAPVPAAFNPAPPIRKAYISRLKAAHMLIESYRVQNGTVPEGRRVEVLHEAGITGVSTEDPWGNRLRYEGGGGHYAFSSAGPDKSWNTADDIRIEDGLERK